jgi:carbamoyltransferase
MKKKARTTYLGIGKTMYNTGATRLEVDSNGIGNWVTSLSERVERKKFSRAWPLNALKALRINWDDLSPACISHNSDISNPELKESLLAKASPFYEMLDLNGLSQCTKKGNPGISYIEHHLAHAFSSLIVSPFDKCFVLVMDGGGSRRSETSFKEQGPSDDIEHTTLYYWNGSKLEVVLKEWLSYTESSIPGRKFSRGVGSLYEKAAEFIFNDSLASGKVMGLAGFGKKFSVVSSDTDYFDFLNSLSWDKAFVGKSKEEWQENENMEYWKDLAASVQYLFEENLKRLSLVIQNDLVPRYGNLPLIMTGGCALNCTANELIRAQNIVPEIFVSPFPGDESISLGCSIAKAYGDDLVKFVKKPWEEQSSFYGPLIDFNEVPIIFKDYEVKEISNYSEVCSQLSTGEVIGWFQGRSECGPRALGHRSLLASVSRLGLKDFLNLEIKFREDFRPYGASLLFEDANLYFDIPKYLQNPFMSFATPIRSEFKELLKEVCHVDGTCRMQTVMKQQNESFYELLNGMKKMGELPILLNTSLNIMGEPIVESLKDALVFLENSRVNTMVIDKFLIKKRDSQ